MATAFTHAFAGAALGKVVFPEKMPTRFWALSVLCAVLPDVDVLGFRFGVRYGAFFGHRGFSHSIIFALVLGFIAAFAFPMVRRFSKRWWLLAGFFFLTTASHDVLDAMTDGGYGVAFFDPFDRTRYFFPWRPLHVSPIGIHGFLNIHGLSVLMSELLWVWLPMIALLSFLALVRARSASTDIQGAAHKGSSSETP